MPVGVERRQIQQLLAGRDAELGIHVAGVVFERGLLDAEQPPDPGPFPFAFSCSFFDILFP